MKLLRPIYLFPLILLGLLMGLVGGWTRLGYTEWMIAETVSNHGLLMVGGFLGTLISLERAMVMKSKNWLFVPFLSGLSVPVLLLGWPILGASFLMAASVGLVIIMYLQTLSYNLPPQYVMALGAVSWMLGNFAFLYSGFMPMATSWWMGFLLLTILGERLELSKFLPTPRLAKKGLVVLIGLFFGGMAVPFHGMGNWLMGGSVIFMSFWLLHFDMAKIASRKKARFKYIGVGLRVGYLWLTVNGLILCFLETHPFYYDLFLHTFFLGFVISMIWSHAPIIFPMVLNIKHNPYHPILWIGWSVFQLSLLGRVGSSLLQLPEWRTFFGVINGYSILLIFGLMASIVLFKMVRDSKNPVKFGQVNKDITPSKILAGHRKKMPENHQNLNLNSK